MGKDGVLGEDEEEGNYRDWNRGRGKEDWGKMGKGGKGVI